MLVVLRVETVLADLADVSSQNQHYGGCSPRELSHSSISDAVSAASPADRAVISTLGTSNTHKSRTTLCDRVGNVLDVPPIDDVGNSSTSRAGRYEGRTLHTRAGIIGYLHRSLSVSRATLR
jgi:hypothetical protein